MVKIKKSEILVGAVVVVVSLLFARGVVGNLRGRVELNENSGVSGSESEQMSPLESSQARFLSAEEVTFDGAGDSEVPNPSVSGGVEEGTYHSVVDGPVNSGEFDSSTPGVAEERSLIDDGVGDEGELSSSDSGGVDEGITAELNSSDSGEEGISPTAGDGSTISGQFDSASPVGAEEGVSPSTAVAGDVEDSRPIDCFNVASAPGGVEEIPCSSNQSSADFFQDEIRNSSGRSAVNSSASSSVTKDEDDFVFVEDEDPTTVRTTGGSTGGVRNAIFSIFKMSPRSERV